MSGLLHQLPTLLCALTGALGGGGRLLCMLGYLLGGRGHLGNGGGDLSDLLLLTCDLLVAVVSLGQAATSTMFHVDRFLADFGDQGM